MLVSITIFVWATTEMKEHFSEGKKNNNTACDAITGDARIRFGWSQRSQPNFMVYAHLADDDAEFAHDPSRVRCVRALCLCILQRTLCIYKVTMYQHLYMNFSWAPFTGTQQQAQCQIRTHWFCANKWIHGGCSIPLLAQKHRMLRGARVSVCVCVCAKAKWKRNSKNGCPEIQADASARFYKIINRNTTHTCVRCARLTTTSMNACAAELSVERYFCCYKHDTGFSGQHHLQHPPTHKRRTMS